MTTRRAEPDNVQLPSPFPEGWYFIASRKAIQKATAHPEDLDGGEHRRLVR